MRFWLRKGVTDPLNCKWQKAYIECFNILTHLPSLIWSCADLLKGTLWKSKSKNHSSWHICQALSPNHQEKGKGSVMYLRYVFFLLISMWPKGELEVCIQYRLSFSWFTSSSLHHSLWCTTLLTMFAVLLDRRPNNLESGWV